MPFWRGEGPGRPLELGRALGAFVRELGDKTQRAAESWLAKEAPLERRAARNLWRYVADQREATGTLPTDRDITIERFRDELGDFRICILSPFGARVHAPWALALEARLGTAAGFEVQTIWSDDGIVLRFAGLDDPPELLDAGAGSRGDRGAGAGAAHALGAVRDALPRERGARPAAAAAAGERAHAAVGAAPEGAEPDGGGAAVPQLPDRPRDGSGVPAGRVRSAGAEGPAGGDPPARGAHRRGRDRLGLPLRALPGLRLRRRVHVRGGRAAGRAAGAGADAGSPAAAGAAGARRAGGAAGSGGAGRRRSRAAVAGSRAAGPSPRRRPRSAAADRRPVGSRAGRAHRAGGRGRRGRLAARAGGDAPGRAGAHRRRGPLDRRRGHRALPRRAGRAAARRHAAGAAGPGRKAAGGAPGALGPFPRAVHDRAARRALRPGPRSAGADPGDAAAGRAPGPGAVPGRW